MAEIPCPSCSAGNDAASETCFRCGRNLYALTEGMRLSGRYEILRLLGRGGMGIVYVARDAELDETVALKVLRPEVAASPDIAQRFRSEIKLARKVTHPNVCRIHEYQHDGHRHYIVMELVDGVDLREILKEKGPFPPDEAYGIAIQVANALQAIHDVGVVHRDLKTPNIMRDASGVVRVMDFGVAKSVGATTSGATATGHVVGTPEYMSPEQATGGTVDGRSDLYALAVVIYELLTGNLPLQGDSPMATLYKQVNDPPPLDGPAAALLPREVVPILACALAKAPSARFTSAREMAQALEAARAGRPLATLQGRTGVLPTTAPAAVPVRPRPRGVAVTVAIVFLLAALALPFFLRRLPAPIEAPRAIPSVPPSGVEPVRVRLNALPWARVRVSAAGPGAVVPVIAEAERTTPCALALTEGEYQVELDNGGLTAPLVERIRVQRGGANDFTFTMPAYDPAAALRALR